MIRTAHDKRAWFKRAIFPRTYGHFPGVFGIELLVPRGGIISITVALLTYLILTLQSAGILFTGTQNSKCQVW